MDCTSKLSLILFISSLYMFFQSHSSSSNIDKEALLAIKAMITSDPSNTLSTWIESDNSSCQWSGIRCDHHQRVSTLDLQTLGLTGIVSPYIGNLTSLRNLCLQNNQLTGNIPTQIGHLNRLEVLNMTSNIIQGSIPSNITMCTNLTTMDLSANRLSDNIPVGIGALSKLQYLNLEQNQLSGPIPQSMGNLSNLVTLNLNTNNLSETIPSELGHLQKLKQLQISLNNLTGTVPTSLYKISSLETFAIVSNDLYGELPSDVGFSLPNLLVFHVCYNSFTGKIPPSLHNVTKIQSIKMAHNYFVGSVPPGLDKLHDLTSYDIGYNQLVDNLDFIDSLTNSTKLQFLAVDGNRLHGHIPPSIGNLSSTLANFFIGGNQISGTIPKSIGQLTSLTSLNMTDNSISGEIPPEIGQLKLLQMLSLAMNRFSGEIPVSLGNLSRINKLEMYKNQLEGSIPDTFGEFRNLLTLDLSSNNLQGNIPAILFTLTSLTSLLNLSNNSLSGPLPKEIGMLENIVVIDISNNHLIGNITDSIGECNSLQYLSMPNNSFYGQIPNTIGNLKALQSLDLSSNKLSGPIPENIEEMGALQFLNLSFNNLEGEVPTEGVFKNHSAIYLQGNPNLCFSNSLCAAHHKKLGVKFVVAIVLTSLVICILVVLLLWVLFFRKNKGGVKVVDTIDSMKGKHRMISYDEILRATKNFDPTYKIGTGSFGSVYKGLLSDGMISAIKVLNLTIRGASKSFIAECEALRNVRHRNLVKLITSCSSVDFANNDFRALVYEFMSNGCLEDWISGRKKHEDGKTLSLLERLDIAIDVASAMDYLHNDCDGIVLHCDLKPSNVLLDEEMNAKVGDFGLAKLLVSKDGSIESSFSITNGLKGSIGYIPPEYGFGGKPSREGDVYSYGVMLLQLITGRSPTDEIFEGGLSLEKWVRACFPDRVVELIETDLLGSRNNFTGEENQIEQEKQIKCLISMTQIGLSCAVESPDDRCSLRGALQELKNIKKKLVQ